MELNDHSLRQMDEDAIRNLPEAVLRDLAVRLLKDLKEAREQLNQNSQNSSRPPGSDAPWAKIGVESEDDVPENAEWDEELGASEDCEDAELGGVEQSDADGPSEDASREADNHTVKRKSGKQPGTPGFGRQQQLPVTACVHHRPTDCDCCGKVLDEAALDSQWHSINPKSPIIYKHMI